MNVAETLRGPARTWIAGVETVSPPAVDLEQRGALAVDRDFHLDVADRAAEEQPGGFAVEQQLELVFAVGGEVVRDDRAAARAERRALDTSFL